MIIIEFISFWLLFTTAAFLILLGIAWIIDFVNDLRKKGES